MSPWELLGWVVAVSVSVIVLAFATAVVIAVVKGLRRQVRRGPSESHPASKPNLRIVD